MQTSLCMLGPAHLAILGTVPFLAVVLAALQRRFPRADKGIRYGLVFLLLASTIAYYGSFAVRGVRMFPDHLPLELCDASLWLIIVVLLTLRSAVFDVEYYWALVGASASLLTPSMAGPSAFLAIQFFADHGLIVVAALYLVWSGGARPRPGSVRRSMLALNLYAAAVGFFDFVFKTNYMYLRVKPAAQTLLDILGPWPWYIASCEALALVLFLLLYLPFRRMGRAT